MEYAYPSFRLPQLLEARAFQSGPYPGEEFPDFDLPTTQGGRITRAQLLEDGPALITLGSFTCSMTASAATPLKQLYREFGHPVRFLTLYVRETHPGSEYPQARTHEQKISYAREYRRRDRIPWTVAVDDPEGTLHRQLDSKPNSAYLLGPDGIVLFRSLWSNHEWTLREALAVVAAGGRPMEQREPRVLPAAAGIGDLYRMLEMAGDDAKRAVLYNAPPMYALARIAHVLPLTGPLRRGLGALGVALGLGVGGAMAAARSRREAGVERRSDAGSAVDPRLPGERRR